MGSKIQRKLKWHCGRSFRQRREVPFVIDLSVMDEMSAQREQHRIVNGAVWLMCVRLTQRLIKSLCSRKYKSSFFYNGYFTTVSAIDDNVAQFMIWDRNICDAVGNSRFLWRSFPFRPGCKCVVPLRERSKYHQLQNVVRSFLQ